MQYLHFTKYNDPKVTVRGPGGCANAGVDIYKEPLKAKRHVSYVSENVQLYGNFSAIQNLEFFAKVGGKPGMTRAQVESTLIRVGLPADTHHRSVKGYSKGMRQRLGIAIAVIRQTELILLDEPTSGLDPKGGQEFVTLLKELRAEGRAILMTTHDIFREHCGALFTRGIAQGRIRLTEKEKCLSIFDSYCLNRV